MSDSAASLRARHRVAVLVLRTGKQLPFLVDSNMSALDLLQLISGILLIGAILLQRRGTGLGSAFGGEGNAYRTIRGFEKTLVVATVVLAFVFFGAAFAHVMR